MFREKYRQFVSLDSAREAYAVLFEGLADPERLPAILHCATGKDRTGWAIAALQLLLGVPHDAVLADFLASNAELTPTLQPFIERFVAAGGDAEILEPMAMVRPAYLDVALDEMAHRFGTIEAYFADGLGLDARVQERLRNVFVEAA
jgi:protein-tyrosine phosphatase